MKFINTKMWFSHKLEQDNKDEEIVELTQADVLKTIDLKVPSKNIKENTQPMNELSNQIDTIVTAIKNAIGISNEVEEKTEVQEIETVDEQTEETVEVQETEEKTDDAQTVSEETEEVQDEQTEQPRNEEEGIEPPETEAVETEEKTEEQEETVEETVEEGQEEHQEEVVEELNALENSLETKEEKEESAIEDKTSALLQEIENLKAEKLAKEIQLEKMEFSKEVAKDYEGVPGKLEDKTEKIFEIKNSALSEDTKAFILQSLKSLSLQNLADCQEIGHDLETETDEKAENQAQIKNLMEKENLTENQAFLVVNGFRSLAEAKKASARVQTRK